MVVLIPAFSPTGELPYTYRYARWGDSLPEVAVGLLARPALTLEVLLSTVSLAYLAKMLAPLWLWWWRPSFLLVGTPITVANLLSSHTQQDIKYHYSAYLTAVVAIAAMLGAAGLGARHRVGPAVAAGGPRTSSPPSPSDHHRVDSSRAGHRDRHERRLVAIAGEHPP